MAGQGAGPSRRSHTKSRKGCKTCKRRHIRCDETFPQCRNCTKHQVRCDYMDNVGSDAEQQSSPEQSAVQLTPGSEGRVDLWQQTGVFPYSELQVFPPPPTHEYSRNDLRLMHHLSSISNDLRLKGSTNLTLWTHRMPRLLSIASSYPFVMHALLSFSANHLAWLHNSNETRNLHIHHGSVALRGLHEAIGTFSHANADAVLAASLLMLWQATDWRSWSSLRSGIQSVLSTMQSSRQESSFADSLAEEELTSASYRTHRRRPSLDPGTRAAILQGAAQALQRAQMALSGHDAELDWINQLCTYIQRLQTMNPAQTPEEQFVQLYYLRKWLFWVPVSLLQRSEGQGPAMLALAHFYAVSLAMEPLFPDLGASFCSALGLAPLEAIIRVTDSMQSEQTMSPGLMEIATVMQYPTQMALQYRAGALQQYQQNQIPSPQDSAYDYINLSPETLRSTTSSSLGNLSPAFAPPALHYTASSSSTAASPFLEVPTPSQHQQQGFSYGTQSWGVPSPGLPPAYGYQTVDEEEHEMSLYAGMGAGGYMIGGGFVLPPHQSIWT